MTDNAAPRTAAGRLYVAYEDGDNAEAGNQLGHLLGIRHWTVADVVLAIEAEAAQPQDEAVRLRSALEQIAVVENTRIRCVNHGGTGGANPDECGCGISLDSGEKAIQIARAALAAKTPGSSDPVATPAPARGQGDDGLWARHGWHTLDCWRDFTANPDRFPGWECSCADHFAKTGRSGSRSPAIPDPAAVESGAAATPAPARGLDVAHAQRIVRFLLVVHRMVMDGHPDDERWFRIVAEALHTLDDLADEALMDGEDAVVARLTGADAE